MNFIHNCIQPDAVTMFVLTLVCLVGYGVPGYRDRGAGGFIWLLWLLAGVMALVAWVILVFS